MKKTTQLAGLRKIAIVFVAATSLVSCGGHEGDDTSSAPGSSPVSASQMSAFVAESQSPTTDPAPGTPPPEHAPPVAVLFPAENSTLEDQTPPVPAPPPTPPSGVATPIPVEPIVLGRLTWSFIGTIPDDKKASITDAMDYAVNVANTVSNYSANIRVAYNAKVPTAQSNYNDNITFGKAISRRVAVHEQMHWLGVGGYWGWQGFVVGGRWTGEKAIAQMRVYRGPTATVSADKMHFWWPYGWNYDSEGFSPQRNVAMTTAFRKDMRLSDGMSQERIGGTYRFQNRSSLLMLASSSSVGQDAAPVLADSRSGTDQQWVLEPGDGFVTLRNVNTGLSLDGVGASTTGSLISLRAISGGTTQQWEMVPVASGGGWFQLQNRDTGLCLDNLSAQTASSKLGAGTCGTSLDQQFHLAR
jgi:hypothetical protein